MRKLFSTVLLAGVLACGFSTFSRAQQRGGPQPREISAERREQVEQEIESLRKWMITQHLDLDEKTAALVYPIISDFGRRQGGVERRLRHDMMLLRKALDSKAPGELRPITGSIEESQEELHRLKSQQRAALKKVLTVEQQAEYLFFELDLEQELRRLGDGTPRTD